LIDFKLESIFVKELFKKGVLKRYMPPESWGLFFFQPVLAVWHSAGMLF